MSEFRPNRCELTYFEDGGRWFIMAEPGTDRHVHGSILWESDHEPTFEERRAIWQAVDYGIRLATRGASIYADSMMKKRAPEGAVQGTEGKG